jgi:hypothetical protein
MMAFVMLAVYLGIRRARRPRAAPAFGAGSAAALAVAVFITAPADVLVPALMLAGRARRRFLAGGLIASALLAGASIVAFGPRLPGLFTQSRLVTAIGIPILAGLALGQGGETSVLRAMFSGLVVLSTGVCALWAWRAPWQWARACTIALLVLVVSLSWAAPWYVLWILPFAALSGGRWLRSGVIVLSAYFILAFMPAAAILTSDLGFRPAATRLGRLHTLQIDSLVRWPPA